MAPLLADLREFISDHRAYGLPTPDATEPAWNGCLLMVACPWLVTLTVGGKGGRISFGVNRTTVKPPRGEIVPCRTRRLVLACRCSSATGCVSDSRPASRRSRITFTLGTLANAHPRVLYSVPFRRTTMSNSTRGNDRDGRDSSRRSSWIPQTPWVGSGFSNGSRIPR